MNNGCNSAVAVLLATYNPNPIWLEKQLQSLNNQDYPNLVLYILDDCSTEESFKMIEETAAKCITAYQYQIERNKTNLGTNKTFEELTKWASASKTDYLTYCDQDDIWRPDKISVLVSKATDENAILVCSDMKVIDNEGKTLAESLTKVLRIKYRSGYNLTSYLLKRNFVTGCAMLVDSKAAKEAIPFCPYNFFDQYIALHCSKYGKIISVPDLLLEHRVHCDNQSLVIMKVSDKKSYERYKLIPALHFYNWLFEYFPCSDSTKQEISRYTAWLQVRINWWNGRTNIFSMLHYSNCGFWISMAEICFHLLPDGVFEWFLTKVKRNRYRG